MAATQDAGAEPDPASPSQDPGPTAVAVFDIDGVLADVRHRLHHIGTAPKDWESFFVAAAEDPLLAEGAELVIELADTYDIVYLTGRPERTRDLTSSWLDRNSLPAGRLLMRPDRDHRPARAFKRESLRELAATQTVVLMVDDDPEVIATLHADGATTRLADWLPYSDPMREGQERDGQT